MNRIKKEVVIVGTGPAGLSAALYINRYHLDMALIGKEKGGMAILAPVVENYPGVKAISGVELMQNFEKQIKDLGVEIIVKDVKGIVQEKENFIVKTKDEEFEAQAVILATGSAKRKLGVRRENELIGQGVHYCAVCDGALYNNKKVVVVGGGDSGCRAADLLAGQGNAVYLIEETKNLCAMPALVQHLDKEHGKVEFLTENSIAEIKGKDGVESVILKNPYKDEKELKVDGIFIEIGTVPESRLAKEISVLLNKKGEIIINGAGETNIRGVFAAGDVTNLAPTKQIITSVGQGASAAISAYNYLKD